MSNDTRKNNPVMLTALVNAVKKNGMGREGQACAFQMMKDHGDSKALEQWRLRFIQAGMARAEAVPEEIRDVAVQYGLVKLPFQDRNGVVHNPMCCVVKMIKEGQSFYDKGNYGMLRWKAFGIVTQFEKQSGTIFLTKLGVPMYNALKDHTLEAKEFHLADQGTKNVNRRNLEAAWRAIVVLAEQNMPAFTCTCGSKHEVAVEEAPEMAPDMTPEPEIVPSTVEIDMESKIISVLTPWVRRAFVRAGYKGHKLAQAQRKVWDVKGHETFEVAAKRYLKGIPTRSEALVVINRRIKKALSS